MTDKEGQSIKDIIAIDPGAKSESGARLDVRKLSMAQDGSILIEDPAHINDREWGGMPELTNERAIIYPTHKPASAVNKSGVYLTEAGMQAAEAAVRKVEAHANPHQTPAEIVRRVQELGNRFKDAGEDRPGEGPDVMQERIATRNFNYTAGGDYSQMNILASIGNYLIQYHSGIAGGPGLMIPTAPAMYDHTNVISLMRLNMMGYGPVGNAARSALTAQAYFDEFGSEGSQGWTHQAKFRKFLKDFSCQGDVIDITAAMREPTLGSESVKYLFGEEPQKESIRYLLSHSHCRTPLQGNEVIAGIMMRSMDCSVELDDGTYVTAVGPGKGLVFDYTREDGGHFMSEIREATSGWSSTVAYNHPGENAQWNKHDFVFASDFKLYLEQSKQVREKAYAALKEEAYKAINISTDEEFQELVMGQKEAMLGIQELLQRTFNNNPEFLKRTMMHRAREKEGVHFAMNLGEWKTSEEAPDGFSAIEQDMNSTFLFEGFRWERCLRFTVTAYIDEESQDRVYSVDDLRIKASYRIAGENSQLSSREFEFQGDNFDIAQRKLPIIALYPGDDIRFNSMMGRGHNEKYSQLDSDIATYIVLRDAAFFSYFVKHVVNSIEGFSNNAEKNYASLDITDSKSFLYRL